MNRKKRILLIILGVILALTLLSFIFNHGEKSPANQLAGIPVQGVPGQADYRLIPVLSTQGTEAKQVYLNTQVTPALFFAPWCEKCQKEVPEIQAKITKMGVGIHKPLVLVSTFSKTSDAGKAISDAKEFEQKYQVSLPLAVQVGPPTTYVKQVPTLVYTDDQGKTHLITDPKQIIDALNTILTLPSQQQPKTKTTLPAKK